MNRSKRSETPHSRSPEDFDYDVCLSFAGEERAFVEQVADGLRTKGIRVFYDAYVKANLWGKDLYTHLGDIYRNSAYYCVLFASNNYSKKLWTNHERKNAQARAFSENSEYILPAKFDDCEIPGLLPTVGYIDLKFTSPAELVELVEKKLGDRVFKNFLPTDLDLLHGCITPKNKTVRKATDSDARHLFHALKRMSSDEIKIIFHIFVHGCSHELPENVHIDIDLLCRYCEMSPQKIRRVLSKLIPLGFKYFERKHPSTKLKHTYQVFSVEWHNRDEVFHGNATLVASLMIDGITQGRCEKCAWTAFNNLDFSSLSSITLRDGHIHD